MFQRFVAEEVHLCIIYDAINSKNSDYEAFADTAIAAGCQVLVCETPTSFASPKELSEKTNGKHSIENISKFIKEWEETPPQYDRLIVDVRCTTFMDCSLKSILSVLGTNKERSLCNSRCTGG